MINKNDLLAAFIEQLTPLYDLSLADFNFHIALSGGLDSVVLLHLFSRLRAIETSLTLTAHHINHGLSENSRDWEAFCGQLCADLEVNFECSRVNLQKQSRTSLEALARDKRYACLKQTLSANSYLVTAHHQDDQLETVLLALKRGAGNTGLQGIRSKQKLEKGYLIRPLLNFSRQQLASYAALFQLHWIEDESNKDQAFDRNYIRHTISPLLKARWPAIAKTVARSAAICQEQQQLLDDIAQSDFARCTLYKINQNVLDINKLKALSKARRNNVLRYWLKANALNYPSAKQLLAIWQDVVLAADDRAPKMVFNMLTLRRYREHLYLFKAQKVNEGETVVWNREAQLNLLEDKVTLCFDLSKESGAFPIKKESKIEICFRAHLPAKLSCTPIGRSGSRLIKKLLHEYHVPPWLRDYVPFIFIDGELVGAVGLWQCQTSPVNHFDEYLSISFV